MDIEQIESRLMDRNETAAILGISVRLLEIRAKAGRTPGHCRLFGTTNRWDRKVIDQWISQGCPDIQVQKAHDGADRAISGNTSGAINRSR